MSYLIVSDSSSNKYTLPGVNYKSVPLHVLLGTDDWADTPEVDINEFHAVLDAHKGKTASSCPSPDEWLNAFGDAETIFCFTISSGLSGSFNSVQTAKHLYEEQHPGRKVYLVDSFGAGASQTLHIYHLVELLKSRDDYDKIYEELLEYRDHTDILYTLESMKMLASAGRVNPLIAKAIGVLDVRLIGTAKEGKIEMADKARGYKKSIIATFKNMLAKGYNGGKVVLCHNRNMQAMDDLCAMIRGKFPDAEIDIHDTTVLCSYYAEKGGFIVGFET